MNLAEASPETPRPNLRLSAFICGKTVFAFPITAIPCDHGDYGDLLPATPANVPIRPNLVPISPNVVPVHIYERGNGSQRWYESARGAHLGIGQFRSLSEINFSERKNMLSS
jgi:hypothetical protein